MITVTGLKVKILSNKVWQLPIFTIPKVCHKICSLVCFRKLEFSLFLKPPKFDTDQNFFTLALNCEFFTPQTTHNLIHSTHTLTHTHVLHFHYCSKKFLDWSYIRRNNDLFLYIEIVLIFFIIYNVLFRHSQRKLLASCISYEDFVVSSDF